MYSATNLTCYKYAVEGTFGCISLQGRGNQLMMLEEYVAV